MDKDKWDELKAKIKAANEERKRNYIPNLIKFWTNLKPFTCPDDIPDLPKLEPKLYKEIVITNLIRCGAIPKDKLVVGKTYVGACRNAEEATWNGKDFDYKRYKFGTWYDDNINHFENDDGYDLFVPIKEKEF